MTMIQLVTTETSEIERTDEPWKYPYVAAAVDFGSNFQIEIQPYESTNVGYLITPKLEISSHKPSVIGFLDDFCMNHGLSPKLRERGNNYRLDITKRDDIEKMFQLIQPYTIVQHEMIDIVLSDFIPGMNEGKNSNKEGFIELMECIDEIREHRKRGGELKYTADYFREEWDL